MPGTGRIAAQRGFTIIEVIMVVAIGGILAAIAVPALRDTLNTTRQSSAVALLVNDLNQARGEAIKRNGRVLVCGRNADGSNCAGVTDWRVGWVVCSEDAAVVNTCAVATALNPNPLLVRPPLDPSLTLTASDVAIRFNANSSQGAGGTATATLGGSWGGATNRVVTVAGTGHISK